MAAPGSYFVKTATFKAQAVTGLVNFDIAESGNPTDLATDGSKTITMTYLNSIGMDVSLDTTDVLASTLAVMRAGQAGILILVLQKRAEGAGPAAASDKTATFANAVMLAPSAGVPHEGNSTMRFNWRCSDPNGVSAVVWS